jgi:hypothetical protein
MNTKFILTSNEDEKDTFIVGSPDDIMDLKTQRKTYKMFRKILTRKNKNNFKK